MSLQKRDTYPGETSITDRQQIGMKLPATEQALVEREKVVGYLLNLNHRYGASKARFFMGFGFQAEAWETFAAALREHCQQHEVTLTKETGFGPRYEVEGELAAPDSYNERRNSGHLRRRYRADRSFQSPGSSLTCMMVMIHTASGFTTYMTAYGNPLANRRRAGGSNCCCRTTFTGR
jgi:hypothetical protein